MNRGLLKTKVAIIGLGKIGKAIAINLTKGGHDVIVASREIGKARDFAESLGSKVIAEDLTTAIKNAEVVIPAISFDLIKVFLTTYSNELDGKIIVDVSNPIASDGKGGFKKIIEQEQSAGNVLYALLPPNAVLIKAFGTLGAGSLSNEAFSEPQRKVLFYASNSSKSNEKIEELIRDSGFEALLIGGIDQSIHIEVFGDLHQFGALGKTVTLEEAMNATFEHSI